MKEEIRYKEKEIGHKDWWNKSCTKKKRGMQRVYRKWREEKINRERYLEERRKWKEHLEQKRERKKKEEKELKKIEKGKGYMEVCKKERG